MRVEHGVFAVAAVALVVLIVLPLALLVWGSVTDDGRLTLAHFREALREPALRAGAPGTRSSSARGRPCSASRIGLPLAWAVSRTNVPAKRFLHLTAVVAYVTPPFLTAIAFVNLFSPNAGLVNRFVRDVLGRARAHVQRLLDGGAGARHRAPHLSVRVPAGGERARVRRRLDGGVGADPGRRPLAHGARR